ncbi:MAG: fibronectin type III domain-containing protein [Actinomycetota bacterium]|nr:fibronectin type III domain-containing protein [Actinomycetota bacterium]
MTFNPASGTVNAAGVKSIGVGLVVSCPATTQCTALDGSGNEATFNPASGALNPAGIKRVDSTTGAGCGTHGNPCITGTSAVSCPSASQCTVADLPGNEVTFDPRTGTVNAAGPKPINPGKFASSVSCPSTSQCTAVSTSGNTVNNGGDEVTFDPSSGNVNTIGVKATGIASLGSVACPSTSQCTATSDTNGTEVTFDPTSSANASPVTIAGAGSLRGVACPSAAECVAVDQASGFTGMIPGPTPVPVAQPAVTTKKAGSLTATSAVLHGLIDTKKQAVSWQFQFGTSTSYNKATPSQEIPAGNSQPVAVSWKLLGLEPHTTYHFRLVALTSQGAGQPPLSTRGADLSFRTGSIGKLGLVFRKLKVSHGSVRVALKCASQLTCKLRFSVTTRALVKVGRHKKLGTLVCNTSFTTIEPGKTKRVRVKLDGACVALLRRARGHRIKAQFTSKPRTGQLGIIKSITLTLY